MKKKNAPAGIQHLDIIRLAFCTWLERRKWESEGEKKSVCRKNNGNANKMRTTWRFNFNNVKIAVHLTDLKFISSFHFVSCIGIGTFRMCAWILASGSGQKKKRTHIFKALWHTVGASTFFSSFQTKNNYRKKFVVVTGEKRIALTGTRFRLRTNYVYRIWI